ncbi:MAG: allantoate amidohydrolase [Bacteroidetes bacterium]|nr:allantoate amidohydrolase [Bacteroidota bacterium]
MMPIDNRAARVRDQIEMLASVSEHHQYVQRTFCSLAAKLANDMVSGWMHAAGLKTRVDNMANLRGVLAGNNPQGRVFVMGSHLDTVIDAGKYDGPLGVLLAIDQAARLEAGSLPFDLEVIGFSDEEGVRYHSSYLGSSVVAGCFDQEQLSLKDAKGVSMQQAVEKFGGDVTKLSKDQIPKDKFLGYFEAHIEQGPVLEEKNIPVGVVQTINSQERVEIKVQGVPGHAGTTPMMIRKDALAGAALMIAEVEQLAQKDHENMVATVGKVDVFPGASNVIPGNVSFTLDLRSPNYERLSTFSKKLQQIFSGITQKRGLTYSWNLIKTNKSTPCDDQLTQILSEAISQAGYPVQALTSGAGHDAVAISNLGPVALMFIRCKNGISHHPDEFVATEDIGAAIKVCDVFFDKLSQQMQ